MKLILLVGFLVSTSAFAFNSRMICSSDPLTTSYVFTKDELSLKVEIYHHNGTAYAPIHKGTITSTDLETLKPKAEYVQKLGDHLEFTWPLKSCQFDKMNKLLFECRGGGEIKNISGYPVEGYSVTTGEQSRKYIDSTYRSIMVSVGIDFIGEKFFYTDMDFDIESCTTD